MAQVKNKIIKFFQKEIQYPAEFKVQLIISLICLLIIFSFLIFYAPFDFNVPLSDFYRSTLNVSLFTSGIILLSLVVTPYFFPSVIKPAGYTNLILTLQFTIVAIAAIGLNKLLVIQGLESNKMILDYRYAILLLDTVYFPGMVIANLVNWERKEFLVIDLGKKNMVQALTELGNPEKKIIIQNTKRESVFQFSLDEFVFAGSNENYCDIYLLKNGRVTRHLVRVTFVNLYENLKDYSQIIRCHRTRIVNLSYVSGLIKQGKNYRLKLPNISEHIPVSRDFPIESHFIHAK